MFPELDFIYNFIGRVNSNCTQLYSTLVSDVKVKYSPLIYFSLWLASETLLMS